jgi:hypothetical protein
MLTTKDTRKFISFRPDVSLIVLDDAVPSRLGSIVKEADEKKAVHGLR